MAHNYKKRAFIFKDLAICTHVFLRNDSVKQPLERPYSGPYKVVQRVSDRIFMINVKGKQVSVSVERLKPAYFISDDVDCFVNLAPAQQSDTQVFCLSNKPHRLSYEHTLLLKNMFVLRLMLNINVKL